MNLLTRIGCQSIVVVSCACLTGAALAQTSPPPKVERPDIKVGDSWTYNRMDGKTKAKEYSTVVIVTSVDEKEIRSESKRTDNGETLTTIRNRDLNRLATDTPPGKTISDPYGAEYSFPLEVGKIWEQKVTTTRSNQPDWKTVATLKGKVVGWEQVVVPAGTFNSLKIEINGLYDGLDARGRWNGVISETIWYVPELKNAARWTYQDNIRGRGDFNNDIWELVAYKPAS
jgi:hypothetical protein